MYAGPEPLIAVTASWWYSGSSTTLPVASSRARARARCAASQCVPGLIAAMPWSTSAGVLGMTRTTATPSGSRSSTKAVVIPAAMLTTRLPGCSASRISASRAAMSCGLTTSTTVSQAPAASELPTVRTPYVSASSAARSGRRSLTTTSSGDQPARSRPEIRVSPMTPPPRIATRSLIEGSPLGDQRAEEEPDIGRPLGETPHEVPVPLRPVRHVDAHGLALARETALLVGADAVEHLVLVVAGRSAMADGERAGDVDQARVVRRHHGVAAACHEHRQAADVGAVDILGGGERDGRRLLVSALA